jgi:hypothetical protein
MKSDVRQQRECGSQKKLASLLVETLLPEEVPSRSLKKASCHDEHRRGSPWKLQKKLSIGMYKP